MSHEEGLSKELFDQLQHGDFLRYRSYPFPGRWVVFQRKREEPFLSFWFTWLNGRSMTFGGREGWDRTVNFDNFFIRNGIKHESS